MFMLFQDKNRMITAVIENLQILIARYDQITSSQILFLYENNFMKALNVEEMGFPSLLSFFKRFPETFEVKIKENWIMRETQTWNTFGYDLVLCRFL